MKVEPRKKKNKTKQDEPPKTQDIPVQPPITKQDTPVQPPSKKKSNNLPLPNPPSVPPVDIDRKETPVDIFEPKRKETPAELPPYFDPNLYHKKDRDFLTGWLKREQRKEDETPQIVDSPKGETPDESYEKPVRVQEPEKDPNRGGGGEWIDDWIGLWENDPPETPDEIYERLQKEYLGRRESPPPSPTPHVDIPESTWRADKMQGTRAYEKAEKAKKLSHAEKKKRAMTNELTRLGDHKSYIGQGRQLEPIESANLPKTRGGERARQAALQAQQAQNQPPIQAVPARRSSSRNSMIDLGGGGGGDSTDYESDFSNLEFGNYNADSVHGALATEESPTFSQVFNYQPQGER